jgi:hypothetical protein
MRGLARGATNACDVLAQTHQRKNQVGNLDVDEDYIKENLR